MYLIFYIYTLSLFLSYLYLFFIFGRERKKDKKKGVRVGRKEGWQGGRHGRAKISIYIQKKI